MAAGLGAAVVPVARRAVCRGLLCVVTIAGAASVARGQEPATARAYRGLFEPADAEASLSRRAGPEPVFALSTRVFDRLDSQPSSAVVSDGGPQPSGHTHYAAVEAELSGRRAGRRLSYELSAGGQLRHYQDSRGTTPDQQWGSASVDMRITRSTRMNVSGRVAYAASYALGVPFSDGLAPEGESAQAAGLELAALRNASVGSRISVSRRLGHVTVVEASYDLGRVDYLNRDLTVANSRAAARATRALREGLSLDLRYDYARVASRRDDGRLETGTHEANVSLRFSPSSSRTTSVEVGVTPTLARRTEVVTPRWGGEQTAPGALPAPGYTARLGALARLDHRLSRAWRLGLGYQRALYSDQGYVQPVFVQTGAVRLDGVLSRRVAVAASAAYSSGLASASLLQPPLDSLGAWTRVNLRTSNDTSLYVEYQHASFWNAQDSAPGPAAASRLGRRSLEVGVTIGARFR